MSYPAVVVAVTTTAKVHTAQYDKSNAGIRSDRQEPGSDLSRSGVAQQRQADRPASVAARAANNAEVFHL